MSPPYPLLSLDQEKYRASLVAQWQRIHLPMKDIGLIPDLGRPHMPQGN